MIIETGQDVILDSKNQCAVPIQITPDKIVLAVQGHKITLNKEELNIIFRMSYGIDWELPSRDSHETD